MSVGLGNHSHIAQQQDCIAHCFGRCSGRLQLSRENMNDSYLMSRPEPAM
jgi:hypothetical protein